MTFQEILDQFIDWLQGEPVPILVIVARSSNKEHRPFAHPFDAPIVFSLVVSLRAA